MIKNYNSLAHTAPRKKALQIINSGLEAVNTQHVIRKNLRLSNNSLIIKNNKINLKKFKRVVVIGFGKASSLMGREIEKILGNKITKGIIISTKKIKLKKIKVILGTHPMPSIKNIKATKKIVGLLKELDRDDLVLCLVSGGGSALLCYPNISFNSYIKIIKSAFTSGIDINEFNRIRKRYSYVKGGKLAGLTKAKIISLIFSDVVGDDLATIASGPTYGKDLKNVKNILLLNNTVALEAMKRKAISLGLKPIILTNKLKGEASSAGKNFISSIKKYKNKNCFLFAGETTVTVKGKGKGGRCQELCLGAMKDTAKMKDTVLVSIGTDGRDGPTDAAGAIIDNLSLKKSINKRLNYKKYLKNNDSYHFFKKTNDLVMTGLTGSNVADVGVIIRK